MFDEGRGADGHSSIVGLEGVISGVSEGVDSLERWGAITQRTCSRAHFAHGGGFGRLGSPRSQRTLAWRQLSQATDILSQ